MRVIIEGIAEDDVLRALIAEKVSGVSTRLRVAPTTTRVVFTDENGPKGGVDSRCAFTVELPRRPTVHVEAMAETRRLAFETAFTALERELGQRQERARVSRRRPKKYFLAKRLLVSEVEP